MEPISVGNALWRLLPARRPSTKNGPPRTAPPRARQSLAPADAPDIVTLLAGFGTGGVERVSCLLMNGFAGLGLKARLAVVTATGPLASLASDDIDVVELNCPRWFRTRSLDLLAAIPALARQLRASRPKVLLSPGNHTHVAAALAHRLARSSGTKLVLKITNPIIKDRHGPLARLLRIVFYRWAFERADRILVISRHGERQIGQICRSAKTKTRFVHNPYIADGPRRERQARPAAPRSTAPTVLAVGRLTAQKNHAMLLRALARLQDRPWKLVLLGEGPLEAQLRQLARDLGIKDRIAFEGFVHDTAPYYEQAHLLALSSRWEDLPAVVLEALAAGVPVIATRCSEGLVDVVDAAGHGQLVPPDDEDALADALSVWLARSPARILFEGARRYSITNGVNDHLDAMRPLLGEHAGVGTIDLAPLPSGRRALAA